LSGNEKIHSITESTIKALQYRHNLIAGWTVLLQKADQCRFSTRKTYAFAIFIVEQKCR